VTELAAANHSETVLKKVGKRPQSASVIAEKLGYKTHHGVSRSLGKLVAEGKVVKSDKGYAKV
jgi:hypothetical protein